MKLEIYKKYIYKLSQFIHLVYQFTSMQTIYILKKDRNSILTSCQILVNAQKNNIHGGYSDLHLYLQKLFSLLIPYSLPIKNHVYGIVSPKSIKPFLKEKN